jgi:hypothetical protein
MGTTGAITAVIMLGCGQATSSLGGQVRVDDDFMRSLTPEVVIR